METTSYGGQPRFDFTVNFSPARRVVARARYALGIARAELSLQGSAEPNPPPRHALSPPPRMIE